MMLGVSDQDKPKIEAALKKLLPHIPTEYRKQAEPFLMESFSAIAVQMGTEKVDELIADLEELRSDIETQNTEHMIALGEKYNVPAPYLAIFAAMLNQGTDDVDPLATEGTEFNGEVD